MRSIPPPRRRSVRRGLPAAALALLWLACGEADERPPEDAGAEAGRLPLPDQQLPLLRCAEPAPASPSADCQRDADCGSGRRCVLDVSEALVDRAPVPLTCAPPPDAGEARARCQRAADCRSGLCTLPGICARPCLGDEDCDTGENCQPVEIRLDVDAMSRLMVCARGVAFAPDIAVQNTGRAAGLVPETLNQVTMPILQRHALLYLRGDCGVEMQVQHLESSDRLVLFNIGSLLSGQVALNPVVNTGNLIPVLIPNNPALPAVSGQYLLSVVVDAETNVERISVSHDRRRSILDLNVFYVGGGAWLREGGLRPGNTELRPLFSSLGRAYARIGLRLGEVREYDVVGALREELSVLETEYEEGPNGEALDIEVQGLDALFELSAGTDDAGLNLFILQDMGDVLGVSGGIPGSLGVHGTAASGVALALDVVGLSEAATVLLHEMSHQMGLFHTSEFDGFVVEPLADTPQCSLDNDSNGDGVVSALECREQGGDNLMFWTGTGSALTAQQIEVLKASPALR